MAKFEIRESIVLSNKDQKIFGILHLPQGAKNPPCVLICHGLGGNKTGHFRAYVELSEALAKMNIASFRFDFRGSGDSEGSFNEMTLKEEVSDAITALEYLKNEKRIDNQKIAIFGRSLGGAVSILSAAQFGTLMGVVLWAPIYNGDQWKLEWAKVKNKSVSEAESQELRRINGQVASIDFYTELFDMRIDQALKKLYNVPMLLIHGEQDKLMKIHHSELYMEERLPANAETQFIRLPLSDHDFHDCTERTHAIIETVNWFRRLFA